MSIHRVAGSRGLVEALKEHFATFGIPDKLAMDGGPEFIAGETQSFLKRWGTKHSLSSAYISHSNCWAEARVKTGKRLLRENTMPGNELFSDRLCRA